MHDCSVGETNDCGGQGEAEGQLHVGAVYSCLSPAQSFRLQGDVQAVRWLGGQVIACSVLL